MGAGSVKELIAALVGRKIGLPIPEPAILEIAPELLDLADIPYATDVSIHIGSLAVTGSYTAFPGDYRIPTDAVPTAFAIFAWDMLIENADRQSDNPNLLFDGTTFAAFDHEGALGDALFIGAQPPAWNFRGLQRAKGHALFSGLKQNFTPESFNLFFLKLASLDDEFLRNIATNVPAEWNHQELTSNICKHFRMVRDSSAGLKAELLRTFA